ncbi:hypothetical protein [Undibacterium sp. RuTC16W]|uniref:hypothetical protein n=1 Tax=Undibacterium sp. RuTC16W TaxID=3413048 RepID=UPI003BF0D7CB
MNDYLPVNCEFHDVLESLATRRKRIVVHYHAGDGSLRSAESVITDVFAKSGADWLSLDGVTTVRLDHIHSVDGIARKDFD